MKEKRVRKPRKKWWIWTVAAAAAILLFCLSPLFYFVRSLAVMQVWDRVQEKGSLLEDTIQVEIPGGLATREADWYPFVMNFRADEGFSRWSGQPGTRLSILYNFPAFSLKHGCSRLYDAKSPYYNSFYGAYVVQKADGTPYGFLADGTLDYEKIGQIPCYDYQVLVLGDFGCRSDEFVFDWQVTGTQADLTFAGVSGWQEVDAELTVSGAGHRVRDGVMSYLQYGPPGYEAPDPEFAPVSLKGRVYIRYYPEAETTVCLYVVAGTEEICRRCAEEVLSGTRIRPVLAENKKES